MHIFKNVLMVISKIHLKLKRFYSMRDQRWIYLISYLEPLYLAPCVHAYWSLLLKCSIHQLYITTHLVSTPHMLINIKKKWNSNIFVRHINNIYKISVIYFLGFQLNQVVHFENLHKTENSIPIQMCCVSNWKHYFLLLRA